MVYVDNSFINDVTFLLRNSLTRDAANSPTLQDISAESSPTCQHLSGKKQCKHLSIFLCNSLN